MNDLLDLKRQVLQRSVLFSTLPEADLARLAAVAKVQRLAAQAYLFRKGDPGDKLYVVIRGVVRISTLSADGRETVLNLIGAGQMFGEVAALDGGDRSADATAMGPVELLFVERRDLFAFLEGTPQGYIHLLTACTARVRWATELLEDAQFLDLPARLAKRLLLLARMFGQAGGDGIRIGIRLSQQELAHHMGVSRESVNKLLNAWEAKGMLRRERGLMVLTDLDGLDAVATANGGLPGEIVALIRSA